MGTIWTPGGERPVGDAAAAGPASTPPARPQGDPGAPSDEELAEAQERLRQVREELAATPARDIVANHAIGLWQLAVLHLGLDSEDAPPDLEQARIAIDAMAALVEGVADRLEDHTEPLRAAVANIRMAYVSLASDGEGSGPADPGDSPQL